MIELAPIPGFPKYMASADGRIWSEHRGGHFLKEHYNDAGYAYVTLSSNGVHYQRYVHRLVASAFIPNENGKPQVNHKDEDKSNNRASNLEWVTARENVTYGTARSRAVATVGVDQLRESVARAREKRFRPVRNVDTGKVFRSVADAGRSIGIETQCILNQIAGRSKTCGGFRWEYAKEAGE